MLCTTKNKQLDAAASDLLSMPEVHVNGRKTMSLSTNQYEHDMPGKASKNYFTTVSLPT